MADPYTEYTNGIRAWRQRHGVTLEETADLAGFSPSYLSRIERGERDLRPFVRLRIARALGVRIAVLFPRARAAARRNGLAGPKSVR
jgi:transcriptional regulator with XRE-family HTH domain